MADEQFTLDETVWRHTPRQVLDLLPDHWSDDLKKGEIAVRMQAGAIRAAALNVVANGVQKGSATINPSMWLGWGYLADDRSARSFWEGASFAKSVSANSGFGGRSVMQLFGVRLHAGDISTMFRELAVQVSPSSPPGLLAAALEAFTPPLKRLPAAKPRNTAAAPAQLTAYLSDPEVAAWFAALSPHEKALGIRDLWSKAKADNAPSRVMRKQVEPFVRGRPPGRPRTRN